MILKLLLIISVIYVVYIMFFKKKSIKRTDYSNNKKRTNQDVNEMVECATCGVYCELDEAILSNAKYYCSQECLKKAN